MYTCICLNQVSLEDMTFDDLILESAQSITKATSSLMKAATAAQKELVSQGKMKDKVVDEGDDGQWAQGLISAAALVASATQALCEAANITIQVAHYYYKLPYFRRKPQTMGPTWLLRRSKSAKQPPSLCLPVR